MLDTELRALERSLENGEITFEEWFQRVLRSGRVEHNGRVVFIDSENCWKGSVPGQEETLAVDLGDREAALEYLKVPSPARIREDIKSFHAFAEAFISQVGSINLRIIEPMDDLYLAFSIAVLGCVSTQEFRVALRDGQRLYSGETAIDGASYTIWADWYEKLYEWPYKVTAPEICQRWRVEPARLSWTESPCFETGLRYGRALLKHLYVQGSRYRVAGKHVRFRNLDRAYKKPVSCWVEAWNWFSGAEVMLTSRGGPAEDKKASTEERLVLFANWHRKEELRKAGIELHNGSEMRWA